MKENAPQPKWLVPALIGSAVLGGLLLFSSSSKGGTTAKSGGAGAPNEVACVPKFEDWLIEKQLSGVCTSLTAAPPSYKALQQMDLAPAEFYPYVVVLSDGSFWYYSTPTGAPAKSDNLKNQFNTFLGTLKGHPADMFMVM